MAGIKGKGAVETVPTARQFWAMISHINSLKTAKVPCDRDRGFIDFSKAMGGGDGAIARPHCTFGPAKFFNVSV